MNAMCWKGDTGECSHRECVAAAAAIAARHARRSFSHPAAAPDAALGGDDPKAPGSATGQAGGQPTPS